MLFFLALIQFPALALEQFLFIKEIQSLRACILVNLEVFSNLNVAMILYKQMLQMRKGDYVLCLLLQIVCH